MLKRGFLLLSLASTTQFAHAGAEDFVGQWQREDISMDYPSLTISGTSWLDFEFSDGTTAHLSLPGKYSVENTYKSVFGNGTAVAHDEFYAKWKDASEMELIMAAHFTERGEDSFYSVTEYSAFSRNGEKLEEHRKSFIIDMETNNVESHDVVIVYRKIANDYPYASLSAPPQKSQS